MAIREKARRRKAESPGTALSDIYEKDRGSLDEYQSGFTPVASPAGAAVATQGKTAGLDCFAASS